MSDTHEEIPTPGFGIDRSVRNGQFTARQKGGNGEIVWRTEQHPHLGDAEAALFFLVDVSIELLDAAGLLEADVVYPSTIPYVLTMGAGKTKLVEHRVAHRPSS